MRDAEQEETCDHPYHGETPGAGATVCPKCRGGSRNGGLDGLLVRVRAQAFEEAAKIAEGYCWCRFGEACWESHHIAAELRAAATPAPSTSSEEQPC